MSVRSRIGIGIGMCAMVSLLGGNQVNAADEAAGLWKTMGFQISGAVDASYTQNFNNPNTNVNSLRIFDTQANSFAPNLAQIMVERPANASGSGLDRVGFRARLSFGANARFSRARTNFQVGQADTEMDPQELYAEYLAPIGNGLKIQMGKIHTLIGYEQINSWENPNFSRSTMFGLGQAFTTTGIRFTYPFASWATASIGLINGWDNIEDNNRGKSFEYLLALTPHERFGISFYGSYGAEQSNGNSTGAFQGQNSCPIGNPGCDPTAKRTVVGAIITAKVTNSDTIILEPYYGNESNAALDPSKQTPQFNPVSGNGAGNARWNGLGAYHIHDFNDAWSTRLRGVIWEDAGGARACGGFNNFNGNVNQCAGSNAFGAAPNAQLAPTGQTVWDVTATLQYKPAPSLITRVEYRHDHSNKNVYLQGTTATNNQNTLAFQVVYLF